MGSASALLLLLITGLGQSPRDQLGLEIERHLPGGVRSLWQRDKLGRPLKHEIWSGNVSPLQGG